MNPAAREHRDVGHLPVAVANPRAVHRGNPGEALPALREHRCRGVSVADDRPVPAWPVSAVVAPFDSPVIWVAGVPAVAKSGAHRLRLVPDGLEPYCEVWPLLRAREHWAGPAGRPVGWRCDWALAQQLDEVSAAEVPGIGVQSVSERAAFGEAPCEPASVAVPRVSALLFSGVQPHAVLQVLRERRVVPAVAEALRQRGWVRQVQAEPVSAVLA